MLSIRNNKDLLTLKVFGYSNFKIFFVLAMTSFLLGWLILFFINPVTSAMAKYYEQTKSVYAKDIDHLITFNNNGLWIKENLDQGYRIVTASKYGGENLNDITIFNFDENLELKEKINSRSANIEDLINQGYNKIFLNQSLHSMLSMPFFLFIMTSLASILVMSTLKKSNNVKFIFVGIIFCVIIFYLKDLSVALGQTNRISLTLATWIPVIVIGIISSIGILQINEK